MVATEEGGRVWLAQAPGNQEACIEHVVDTKISPEATVKTDGHATYNQRRLAKRAHDAKVQTKAEKKSNDHLQLCQWAASAAKRWLLATHYGAVSEKHLQSDLDEHAFRHNRRKTRGLGRLVARCLENMIAKPPLTLRQLIRDIYPCRAFEGVGH